MRILTISLLAASSLLLSGCFSFPKFGSSPPVQPIEVKTVPVEKTPLALESPQPLRLKPIEWIVITPQNWDGSRNLKE